MKNIKYQGGIGMGFVLIGTFIWILTEIFGLNILAFDILFVLGFIIGLILLILWDGET